jgi:hypothetical protein
LLAEYREVLLRARIRKRHGLSPAEIDVILTEITANAEIVQVEPASRKQGEHLRRILAAVPSAVRVTGDRRLAGEGQALTPKEFVDRDRGPASVG